MAQQIIIPQFGTSVDRVTILSWKTGEGDRVKKGDLLCEVETDKSALEIESFYTGTILKILAREGDEVCIGGIIAYIGEPGEELPETPSFPLAPGPAVQEPADGGKNELYADPDRSAAGIAAVVKAMPKVRRLARELGVDIAALEPSGESGVVTEADVRSAGVRERCAPVIELSKTQKSVAARIRQSYNEIIPINLTATINVQSIFEVRRQAGEKGNRKPSVDAFFIYAAARAMEKYPKFQYYFDNGRLIHAGGVNIGIAVSTGEDLYIPVTKGAAGAAGDPDAGDTGSAAIVIGNLDAEIKRFKKQAEKRSFLQDDFEDGVFLISNLGMYPVDTFSVIIPPCYSGALSIGRVFTSREPLIHDGSALIDERIVTVMLSVDHRFINGRLAAEFLEELKNQIENL